MNIKLTISATVALALSTFFTSANTVSSRKKLKLELFSLSQVYSRSALVSAFILGAVFTGTAQASIVSIGSSLEAEGRLFTGSVPVITTKTDSQVATTNTLSVADSHTATNAAASTIATASWINNAQGNVNFSEIDLFVGVVPVATSGRNSGTFTYDFSTDTDAIITIDYASAMQASGNSANAFLNAENSFLVHVIGTNGLVLSDFLGNNATGQFSAALTAGNDYTLTVQRYFIGSSTVQGINYTIIDMQQTANFDWQIVSAVPVPAAAWLFGSGLIGLIGVARRKKA